MVKTKKNGSLKYLLKKKPAAQAAEADPSRIGKIRQFRKIAVTFKPVMRF